MLSKKEEPSSIICFKYSLLFSFLLLVALANLELYFKVTQTSNLTDGRSGIISIGSKSSVIAKISFSARSLTLLSEGRMQNSGST